MSDAMNHRFSAPIQVKDSTLTNLLTRLEAATSRLEDIASSAASFEQPTTNGAAAAASSSTPAPAQPAKEAPKEELPQSIEDFDVLLKGDVKAWVDLSTALGGMVAEQVCDLGCHLCCRF
jgi:adenylyl cyclase-associated protein